MATESSRSSLLSSSTGLNEKYQGRVITEDEEKEVRSLISREGDSVQKIEIFLKNRNINFGLNDNRGVRLIFGEN